MLHQWLVVYWKMFSAAAAAVERRKLWVNWSILRCGGTTAGGLSIDGRLFSLSHLWGRQTSGELWAKGTNSSSCTRKLLTNKEDFLKKGILVHYIRSNTLKIDYKWILKWTKSKKKYCKSGKQSRIMFDSSIHYNALLFLFTKQKKLNFTGLETVSFLRYISDGWRREISNVHLENNTDNVSSFGEVVTAL